MGELTHQAGLLVNGLLRPTGCQIAPTPKVARLAGFLGALQGLGFQPKQIYDIGANKGRWTRVALRFFPDADYFLFEPQDHLKSNLANVMAANPKIHWISKGVSDRAGSLTLTVCHRDDSSNFRETSTAPKEAVAEQREVPIVTIDQTIEENGGIVPDLIKIDAEGLDMKVLQGAGAALGKTDVLLVEASILAGFDNDIFTVCEYLSGFGYKLFQITDLNDSPNNGFLWLVELGFIRTDSDLHQRIDMTY